MSKGLGRFFRKTYTDRHGRKRQTKTYYWQYGHRGNDLRESTGADKLSEARAYAKRRIAELQAGVDAKPEKLAYAELMQYVEDYYQTNDLRSTKRLEYARKKLDPFFNDHKAIDIGADLIRHYQAKRKKAGASNGTINREVSFLRQALRLAREYKKLAALPEIPMLAESAPRDVTLTPGELAALIAALSEHHRGWIALAAVTGWRKRAILSRKWSHVKDGTLHLDARASKNKRAYSFPIVGDVARILDAQRAYVKKVQRKTGQMIPWVFCYPDGRAIRFPDIAFKNAAEAIGRPDLHVHDLRRFAASRMADMGVHDHEAMALLGMTTPSIFQRYDIVNDERKKAAVRKIAGTLDAEPARQVVGLRARHGPDGGEGKGSDGRKRRAV